MGLDLAIHRRLQSVRRTEAALTIARALVGAPEILILDDSASALDFATDARLRKALKESTGHSTVFLISQRVSAVKSADRILVAEDDTLDAGTHRELLETNPVYRKSAYSLSERRQAFMLNRKNTQNPQTLRRILRYIRPYLPLVVLSLVLSVLTVALTLYVPILTGHAVDAIAGENLVDFQTLFTLITGISVSISITAIAQWIMNHVNNLITYRIVRSLRTQAFEHLQELPLSYVDRHYLRRSDQPDHHGY